MQQTITNHVIKEVIELPLNCMHHYHHLSYYRFILYVLIAVLGFILVTPVAFAQIGTTPGQNIIEIKPDPPKPFTDITLTLRAYSFDPSRASISWYVNGKLFSEGVGLRSISIKTGPAGNSLTVQAVAPRDMKKIYALYKTIIQENATIRNCLRNARQKLSHLLLLTLTIKMYWMFH